MIPFASQRGYGQDLATHLLNEHDNDYMEVAELRGSISRDLHGAFSEWEVQARTLTKCDNYLYSLSVNPDAAQGQLTRDQYMDYLGRVEDKLGLAQQPRAVIFHIKNGREHCHAVYSRIDVENEKAVHMAFDKDKLMMVTRQFARDHGLTLPDGYFKDRDKSYSKGQLSLYEKAQQDTTGLTKEERTAIVTDIWRRADSPKAFVSGLEQAGYLLCTGNRPYVLVDYYGHMNALPKLIDDKQVRTKDIRTFLEKDYPVESLPDVEEARKLIAAHRQAETEFEKSQQLADNLDCLKHSQAGRRAKLEAQAFKLKQAQKQAKSRLLDEQEAQRKSLYLKQEAEARRINEQREARKPAGLSALLAKISGFEYLQGRVYQYQDKKRQHLYEEQNQKLLMEQEKKGRDLEYAQQAADLDMQRQLRALADVEKRELKSVNTEALKEQRMAARRQYKHMPTITPELKPPDRNMSVHPTKQGHAPELSREMRQSTDKKKEKSSPSEIKKDFNRADGKPNDVNKLRQDFEHKRASLKEERTKSRDIEKGPQHDDRGRDL